MKRATHLAAVTIVGAALYLVGYATPHREAKVPADLPAWACNEIVDSRIRDLQITAQRQEWHSDFRHGMEPDVDALDYYFASPLEVCG